MKPPNNDEVKHALPKIPTGIAGLDEITNGGLPRDRTTVIVGGSGTGKTVLALQALSYGARSRNAAGIFVAFEENSREIKDNAAGFGWDLEQLEIEGKLFFLDVHLDADTAHIGNFDLGGLLATIAAKAKEIGALQIVFDSLDALLPMLDDATAERHECYRLHKWLRQSGLSGILTARSSPVGLPLLKSGGTNMTELLGYMADCSIVLERHFVDRVSFRSLRVMKYRGSQFEENDFPLSIGDAGLEVSSYGMVQPELSIPVARVTSGVASFDSLLGGGYIRGASILILGAPGTGKSTLAGVFAEAACLRRELVLYVSFSSKASSPIRDLMSVGIDLDVHLRSGMMVAYVAHPAARPVEEHMVKLKALIRENKPGCIVIDPMPSLSKAVERVGGLSVTDRLLQHAWLLGITVISTRVSSADAESEEFFEEKISSVADTVVQLSYLKNDQSVVKSLRILKSRGSWHDTRLHELYLSDDGVTIREIVSDPKGAS